MLNLISKRNLFITGLVFYTVLLMTNCQPEKKRIDVSQMKLTLVADRFENDLSEHSNDISFLKQKYGKFFDLFNYQIIQLGTPDTALLKTRLNDFIHDADISNVYSDSRKAFSSFDEINRQLTDAFRHYKYYFPDKLIPRVVTFISGFNYAIVNADSTLGIGLDMYLGSDSKYYPALNIPMYKIRKMNKNYIVADAMKGWAQSEWEQNPNQADLLSQMIYGGKLLYFLEQIIPDAPDSIKTGYTQKQIEWCNASEKNIWSFFVDQNLLFSADPSQIAKYVNEGATTNGFPKESPGNIGQWIGYRIIQSYIEQYPKTSLEQLMKEEDYKKIFRDSKYKPKK